MNDRIKQSLSALVDGETDELEVRRILNDIEHDSELRDTWERYQMMGSIMRNEPLAGVDLSKGIMQALDDEPMDEVPARQVPQTASAQPKRINWLASTAIAASVTVAVLLGVRLNHDLQQPQPLAATGQNAAETQQVAGQAADAVNRVATTAEVGEQELQQAQQKLQEYVLQHAENAALNTGRGMMPFARVASFEEPAADTADTSQNSSDGAAPAATEQ